LKIKKIKKERLKKVFIMTKREYFTNVANGIINDEMIEQSKAYIEALDKTNAKRQAKKTEAQAEVDAKVLAVLTTEAVKAKVIAEATGFTSSRVVASCKRLADEGKVVITKEEKGSRNISWYALAETDGED
jgi:predicted Rossmann fold nucleotide-binding protein DprA/Smf involved in DNA uptake